jgi:hypothetical protein
MCPKIDVMERELKKLEVGGKLNKARYKTCKLDKVFFINVVTKVS